MLQILLFVALLHHSFGAEYDVNAPITLTGTLTGIEWTNPHTHFYLDVKDVQGGVHSWQCEGGAPNTLTRNGWTKVNDRSWYQREAWRFDRR